MTQPPEKNKTPKSGSSWQSLAENLFGIEFGSSETTDAGAEADDLLFDEYDDPISDAEQSDVDDSIAPAGKHILSIFVQYAPYNLAEGNWDDEKETFADRCVEMIGRYVPNFADTIEHRQVLSPLDLERKFGLTG